MKLLEAIGICEGVNVSGSRPNRNNNPGDIRYGVFAIRHGATGQDAGGIAIFPSMADGYKALSDLLIEHYQGLTLFEMVDKYLGIERNATGTIIKNPDNNNAAAYLHNLMILTGMHPADIVDQGLIYDDTTAPSQQNGPTNG